MFATWMPVAAIAVNEIHERWGYVAAGLMGVVGLWGIVLRLLKKEPGRVFGIGFGVAVVAILVQVAMGYYSYLVLDLRPGNQHIFYGIVILFTLAFAYIYRAQLAKRPALYYGLLALFLMGLGIRAIMNYGKSF